MLDKEEKLILKKFIDEKYPLGTRSLKLELCFDYYSGICCSINNLYKKQQGFYLLSESEKINIKNYIKINRHNKNGIEMLNYYNLLLLVINILKKYLPIITNVDDFNEVKEIEIKGLKFLLPDLKDIFLFKIFENINSTDYIWNVEQLEIYMDNTNENAKIGTYSKKQFDKIFSTNNYYVVSASIAVSEKVLKNSQKISVILKCEITDLNMVKITCIDEDLIELIYNNVEKNKFDKIEYIY